MKVQKLFMLLLGCKPPGRFTEQHDILFSIGTSLKSILPDIRDAWPDAGTVHIDAWREVTEVDGFQISVISKQDNNLTLNGADEQLFFLNLGGYKPGEFEEFHYKMLVVSKEKSQAIAKAKQTAFYRHIGFNGAVSHIDDKYGIDVDDVYEIEDILPKHIKDNYRLKINAAKNLQKDDWHLGYTILSKLND
jgi:hypothetical protein